MAETTLAMAETTPAEDEPIADVEADVDVDAGAAIAIPYVSAPRRFDASSELKKLVRLYVKNVTKGTPRAPSSPLDAIAAELATLATADRDYASDLWTKQAAWWKIRIEDADVVALARAMGRENPNETEAENETETETGIGLRVEVATLVLSPSELARRAERGWVWFPLDRESAARLVYERMRSAGAEIVSRQRAAFELRARAYESLSPSAKPSERRDAYARLAVSNPKRLGVGDGQAGALRVLDRCAKIVDGVWAEWKRSQLPRNRNRAGFRSANSDAKRKHEEGEVLVAFDGNVPTHVHSGASRAADMRIAEPEDAYTAQGLYALAQRHFPPCMRALVQRMFDGEHLKYAERKLFVRFAYTIGFDVCEMKAFFDETGAMDASMDTKTRREYDSHTRSLVTLFAQKGSPSCLAIVKTETPSAASACPFANQLIGGDEGGDGGTEKLEEAVRDEIRTNGLAATGDIEDAVVEREHARVVDLLRRTPRDRAHRACFCQRDKNNQDGEYVAETTTTCDCRHVARAQCACTETLYARSGWHGRYAVSAPVWYVKHATGYKAADFPRDGK